MAEAKSQIHAGVDLAMVELDKVRVERGRAQMQDRYGVGRGEMHRLDHSDTGIVWVPAGGPVKPVESLHTHTIGDTTYPVVYSVALTIEAHLVAESFVAAEQLWCDLLSATHRLFGQRSTPGNVRWAWHELQQAGDSRGGREKIVQPFTWNVFEIPGASSRSVVIDAATRTGTFGETDVTA